MRSSLYIPLKLLGPPIIECKILYDDHQFFFRSSSHSRRWDLQIGKRKCFDKIIVVHHLCWWLEKCLELVHKNNPKLLILVVFFKYLLFFGIMFFIRNLILFTFQMKQSTLNFAIWRHKNMVNLFKKNKFFDLL